MKDGKPRPPVFHELRLVASGAFSGLREARSQRYVAPELADLLSEARNGLRAFLTSNEIKTFCQPAGFGPLSLLSGNTYPPPGPSITYPIITVHSHTHLQSSYPVTAGLEVRWYMHNKHATSMAGLNALADNSRDRWETALEERVQQAAASSADQVDWDWSLNTTIYFHLPPYMELVYMTNFPGHTINTPTTVSERTTWRDRATAYTGSLANNLTDGDLQVTPRRIEAHDRVEIRQLFDAPPCHCGWHFSG